MSSGHACGHKYYREHLDQLEKNRSCDLMSIRLDGTVIIPSNINPISFYKDICKLINLYKGSIIDDKDGFCIIYPDSVEDDSFSDNCLKSSINFSRPIYQWGENPPENKGIFWIDTNKRGGLKAYDPVENAWKHVPAFTANIEDL